MSLFQVLQRIWLQQEPSLVASRPQVAEAVAGSGVAIRGGKEKLLPKCSQSAQAPSNIIDVINDPYSTEDPPQDVSLVQSKRVYMTRSKSLFASVLPIPSAISLDVVDTTSRRPGRSRQGAASQPPKPPSL
jgi:hypothetical protein